MLCLFVVVFVKLNNGDLFFCWLCPQIEVSLLMCSCVYYKHVYSDEDAELPDDNGAGGGGGAMALASKDEDDSSDDNSSNSSDQDSDDSFGSD